jgi:hypothetical protein
MRPDVKSLVAAVFGSEARLRLLLEAFSALHTRWGIKLFIVSYAEKAVITRTLELVGASQFFDNGDHIYGWQELSVNHGCRADSKGEFIATLLETRGISPEAAIFFDDEADNIRSVSSRCRCFWIRAKLGLAEDELRLLRDHGGNGLQPLHGRPAIRAPVVRSELASEDEASNCSLGHGSPGTPGTCLSPRDLEDQRMPRIRAAPSEGKNLTPARHFTLEPALIEAGQAGLYVCVSPCLADMV